MSVEIIVPWRGGCPHRARAWAWLRGRYCWPVVEAPGHDPWSKGAAVMSAIERSSANIVVAADADVWPPLLEKTVEAVQRGVAWAMPHRSVHRLTRDATAAVLEGTAPEGQPLEQRAYRGVIGGGVVVARREVILSTPLDPRFTGWG